MITRLAVRLERASLFFVFTAQYLIGDGLGDGGELVEEGAERRRVDLAGNGLRRIRDSAVSRPFSLRIVGLGDVRLTSADPSTPRTTLQAIRDPDRVQDMLRRLVEQRVRQQGVREIDIM